MNRPETSINVFGIYLVGMGGILFLAPNVLLALFGMPPSTDYWSRVVGVLALVLAVYYLASARANLAPFYRATIYGRLLVFVLFVALVLFFAAPPQMVLFGAVDLLGAAWTWWTLRKA